MNKSMVDVNLIGIRKPECGKSILF